MPTQIASRAWTRDEILARGTRIDGVTACEIVYGYRRTKAYEALGTGDVDFRVLRAGRRYVVPTTEILRVLGLDQET